MTGNWGAELVFGVHLEPIFAFYRPVLRGLASGIFPVNEQTWMQAVLLHGHPVNRHRAGRKTTASAALARPSQHDCSPFCDRTSFYF